MIRKLVTRLLDKITQGVLSAEERFGTEETVRAAEIVNNDLNYATPVNIDGSVK